MVLLATVVDGWCMLHVVLCDECTDGWIVSLSCLATIWYEDVSEEFRLEVEAKKVGYEEVYEEFLLAAKKKFG